MNIAVDFDGVIHRYSRGWQDGQIYDCPTQGTKEALESLLRDGHKIIIFTTRALPRNIDGVDEPGQEQDVRAWLHRHEIPYSEIWTRPGKPLAHIYLDDRAICFRGNWANALRDIAEFKPWGGQFDLTEREHPKDELLRLRAEVARLREDLAAIVAPVPTHMIPFRITT